MSGTSPTSEATGPELTPPVRAAGGAVWRRGAGGLEVILVHRPKYDDWSLPKGKLDPGESSEEAAVREVAEEATVVTRLGPELPSVQYVDPNGRNKVVRYWAMTVESGLANGDHEVDAAQWFTLAEAIDRLSYEHDRPVLRRLAELERDGLLT
ncbi:MAG: NUDIX hydrolase [Acidimicrobiaceae bacterium]|nr:NUDIX hydrolase [Acidimicrobiaceae bacterium]MBO0746854.1 NUDIX hydrolase [Acidimicrobiaceae bacterium]